MGPQYNILILATCLALTIGGGAYVTFFDQPGRLKALEEEERLVREMESDVATLLATIAETQEDADLRAAQWQTRYKIIPPERPTTEVMAYLNRLSEDGFRQFDVTYEELVPGEDYNTEIYDIKGKAFFGELYQLVWALENHRDFYRVEALKLDHFDLIYNDPVTSRQRMDVLVTFEFKLHAYFGGKAGLSADDQGPLSADDLITIGSTSELPPVPTSILPDLQPAKNPFSPLILASIPPNSEGLPEIEGRQLVGIIEGKAVFDFDGVMTKLGVGDPVYLGQIVSVDPLQGRVVARLNKGGIIDEIEFTIETGASFRQAMGPQSDPVLNTKPKASQWRSGR